MTALSHYRICVSYNMVKRIDVDLVEWIITTAGDSRVPLPAVLEATSPINGAMDNFDRNEAPWQEQASHMIPSLFSFKTFQSIWRNHHRSMRSL